MQCTGLEKGHPMGNKEIQLIPSRSNTVFPEGLLEQVDANALKGELEFPGISLRRRGAIGRLLESDLRL